MTRFRFTLAAIALLAVAAPAAAQVNGPVPGPYGTEDGYGGDGIGWGPAYRPQTNFRPAVGFYGGVERPYPYARNPTVEATGRLGDPALAAPRRLRAPRYARRIGPARRRAAALRR